MPIYQKRSRDEVVTDALRRLRKTTPITAIGTGSIARALTEALAIEVDNLNGSIDFVTSGALVSSAQGRNLDLLGQLYGIERKKLGTTAESTQRANSFYFYLNSAHNAEIVIPSGVTVSTGGDSSIGANYTYRTEVEVTIPAGRLRAFAPIRPEDQGSVFTAGANTLTEHNFVPPEGVVVLCTNPKSIQAQVGREGDATYRARIVKAVRTTGGGTLQAMRFRALAVEGVRDVKMRDTPFGLGTVEMTVVPESRSTRDAAVANVVTSVNEIRPAGVRLSVRVPDYLAVSAQAEIVVKAAFRGRNTSGVDRKAEVALIRYLNTLLPGDKLIYANMLQALIESTDVIEDARFRSLTVEGQEIIRDTFVPKEFEQFVPGQINVTTT